MKFNWLTTVPFVAGAIAGAIIGIVIKLLQHINGVTTTSVRQSFHALDEARREIDRYRLQIVSERAQVQAALTQNEVRRLQGLPDLPELPEVPALPVMRANTTSVAQISNSAHVVDRRTWIYPYQNLHRQLAATNERITRDFELESILGLNQAREDQQPEIAVQQTDQRRSIRTND